MILPLYTPVKHSPPPRFAGDIDYEYYKAKLKNIPTQTVDKFASIRRMEVDEYPVHSGHIKLAKAFALLDPHIHWFNTKVLALLHLKKTDQDHAEELLSDLRVALEETLMANGYDELGNKKVEEKK